MVYNHGIHVNHGDMVCQPWYIVSMHVKMNNPSQNLSPSVLQVALNETQNFVIPRQVFVRYIKVKYTLVSSPSL